MKNDFNQKMVAPCPDCDQPINLGYRPRQGQNVTCPNCWAYLKIVSLEPLELEWDIEFEDWVEEQ